MRKLLNPIPALIACIALSSCGSNFSITKRHYTGGYYVSYAKHNQTGYQSKREEDKTVQTPKSLPERTFVQAGIIEYPSRPVAAVTGKIQHKAPIRTSVKPLINDNANMIQTPVSQTHIAISGANEYHGDSSGQQALSLLWIIILVILIIWLIGILAGGFGLGGLINLLLIVALVLLILWLLRVI